VGGGRGDRHEMAHRRARVIVLRCFEREMAQEWLGLKVRGGRAPPAAPSDRSPVRPRRAKESRRTAASARTPSGRGAPNARARAAVSTAIHDCRPSTAIRRDSPYKTDRVRAQRRRRPRPGAPRRRLAAERVRSASPTPRARACAHRAQPLGLIPGQLHSGISKAKGKLHRVDPNFAS
jgi:hypothetical protein